MKRRHIIKAGAAFAGATLMAHAAALEFPNKPVTLIVPFAPGGNLDTVARMIAPGLSAQLGQSVIVENRAGAGGAVGAALVAHSEPSGYMLLISTPNAISVLPQMIKTSYKPSSFQALGLVSSTSLAIVVRHNENRFKDAAGMLTYARNNPAKVSAGYAGIGTTNHVGLLLLENAAGVEFNGIPYKGSAPALVDLLGGQIDLVVDQLTSSAPHIQAGKLRALAVMSNDRDPLLKEVPTLREAGLTGFDVATVSGLLAPAGTSRVVVDRINAALLKTLADDGLKNRLLGTGSRVHPSSPEEFQQILGNEEQHARELAKAGKLKPQ